MDRIDRIYTCNIGMRGSLGESGSIHEHTVYIVYSPMILIYVRIGNGHLNVGWPCQVMLEAVRNSGSVLQWLSQQKWAIHWSIHWSIFWGGLPAQLKEDLQVALAAVASNPAATKPLGWAVEGKQFRYVQLCSVMFSWIKLVTLAYFSNVPESSNLLYSIL